MMAVARSSWKADAGARPNGFATRVGHKHELALNHVNELVLLGMRVSRRRLTTGQNANKIDAVILESCMPGDDFSVGCVIDYGTPAAKTSQQKEGIRCAT